MVSLLCKILYRVIYIYNYENEFLLIGTRDHVKNCDLSDILTEDVEERIKTVAEMSMGTEITEQDITNIWYLCDQVTKKHKFRLLLRIFHKFAKITLLVFFN